MPHQKAPPIPKPGREKAMSEKIEEPVECAGLRRFRVCEMALVRRPTTCGKLRVCELPRHFLAGTPAPMKWQVFEAVSIAPMGPCIYLMHAPFASGGDGAADADCNGEAR